MSSSDVDADSDGEASGPANTHNQSNGRDDPQPIAVAGPSAWQKTWGGVKATSRVIGKALKPLIDELSLSYDRGIAIAHLAELEETIRLSLTAALPTADKQLVELIGGGETGGSLGFSDQCRLGYCLGLFGPETLADLKTLARIRNRFAHGPGGLTFGDERIAQLCSKLRTCDRLGKIGGWKYSAAAAKIIQTENKNRSRYFTSIVYIDLALDRERQCQTVAQQHGPRLLT